MVPRGVGELGATCCGVCRPSRAGSSAGALSLLADNLVVRLPCPLSIQKRADGYRPPGTFSGSEENSSPDLAP